MASACIEIETTRDIARQILRHRSFSFQEFSQRYADPTQALDFSTREARLQDPRNRQNSIPADNDGLEIAWHTKQREVIDAATEAYTWAIRMGIAKEQARAVLPEGNTHTRLYMTGTLRSWMHFCDLRGGNGTQKECSEIAVGRLMKRIRNIILTVAILAGLLYTNWQGSMMLAQYPEMYGGNPYL